MELATIARPYAKALFKIEHDTEHLWDEILQILSALVKQAGFIRLQKNPSLTAKQLTDFLLELTQTLIEKSGSSIALTLNNPKFYNKVQRFLTLLAQQQRLLLIPEIDQQLCILKNREQKIVHAKISTAYAFDSQQMHKLKKHLEQHFQSQWIFDMQIDPTLIGGICIQIADQVIDYSIRAQLQQMQQKLTV